MGVTDSSDQSGASVEIPITVIVSDENDNPPTFSQVIIGASQVGINNTETGEKKRQKPRVLPSVFRHSFLVVVGSRFPFNTRRSSSLEGCLSCGRQQQLT